MFRLRPCMFVRGFYLEEELEVYYLGMGSGLAEVLISYLGFAARELVMFKMENVFGSVSTLYQASKGLYRKASTSHSGTKIHQEEKGHPFLAA